KEAMNSPDKKKPAILAGKHVMYLWQIKALYRTSELTHIILYSTHHPGYYFLSFSGISYYQRAMVT
ncbi:hypothetical protein OSK45_28745, partial [Escherichia coli]|nr:hypothetical protein [Escherichia coli]